MFDSKQFLAKNVRDRFQLAETVVVDEFSVYELPYSVTENHLQPHKNIHYNLGNDDEDFPYT